MKNYYALIFVSLISAIANAQCTQAVDNGAYTQHYSNIAAQGNDQLKFDQGIVFTGYNCVSSNQVKAIAMLFNSDNYRLDFCMLSYHNVVDKSEFYEVYDAFKSFSSVFRLHDFVLEQRQYEAEHPVQNDPPVNEPAQLSFPTWNYPSINGYQGHTGCDISIPDSDFMTLAQTVVMYQTDQERVLAASILIEQHCLSMAQLMKLGSLITLESKRLDFMKANLHLIFDQANYTFGDQCFNHQPYKEEWLTYGLSLITPLEPEITCDVDENRFKQMLSKIDNAAFADDQLAIVKMINKDNCFTTAQVKRIMDEFSFPENKLDVAEMLYPKCLDRENYYQLKGSFSFPSYETDFQDLINGN